MAVEFENESQLKDAIAAVRADADDTNWCCLTYANSKSQKVSFGGQGNGGVDELLPLLKEDVVCYALLRFTDQIDDSVTVKFVYVLWIGEKTPRMQKARISIHQGGVQDFIGLYHCDVKTSDIADITTENLMKKVMDVSGSGSHVLEDDGSSQLQRQASERATAPTPGATKTASSAPPSVPKGEDSSVNYDDLDGLTGAIAAVRADDNDVEWAAWEHSADNHVKLAGQGSGGVSGGLDAHLTEDKVIYALVRKTEKFDDSVTVKFCYVYWVGTKVPRMHRARLATYKGEIDQKFNPYHVDINAETSDEVSDEIIQTKIGKTSGTNTNVLDETVQAGFYHN